MQLDDLINNQRKKIGRSNERLVLSFNDQSLLKDRSKSYKGTCILNENLKQKFIYKYRCLNLDISAKKIHLFSHNK